MDKRRNNGGHSTKGKAGRKPKADERKLIEKLSPLEDKAHKALEKAIQERHGWAIKMYFEYMYGKPKESIEVSNVETIKPPTIVFHGRDKDK